MRARMRLGQEQGAFRCMRLLFNLLRASLDGGETELD
jgi:hypothetical protein